MQMAKIAGWQSVLIDLTKEEYIQNDSRNYLDLSIEEGSWKEMDTDKCPICIKLVLTTESTKCAVCKNVYHTPCINEWLQQRHNCPMCRASMVFCSNCKQQGHSRRGCPLLKCGICRKPGHNRRHCPEADSDWNPKSD